jgi:hypothetical protein
MLSFSEYGQLIELCVKANDIEQARKWLAAMRAKLAVYEKVTLSEQVEAGQTDETKAIIDAITAAPVLVRNKPKKHDKDFPNIFESTTGHKHPEAEPEPQSCGPLRDESGKVVRVSVRQGDPGYDPEAHENTDLKIFCDDEWIETAHTADTREGTVWYYKRDDRGRIKTKTVHGEVKIEGI